MTWLAQRDDERETSEGALVRPISLVVDRATDRLAIGLVVYLDVAILVCAQLLAADRVGDALRVLGGALADADLFIHNRLLLNVDSLFTDGDTDGLIGRLVDRPIRGTSVDGMSF